MPNYIKLGNLRIEIPEPANNGGGGGGGGSSSLLTGLLAFYNLSDLTDASGNGNTLTNNNGVTFSAGKIGNAATFNGTNSYLRTTIPGLATATSGDFSIACWVFLNESAQADDYILSQPGGAGLRWGSNGHNAFIFNNGQADNVWLSNLTKNAWYHVGVVASGNNLLMYVNGSLQATLNKQSYPSLEELVIGQLSTNNFGYAWNDRIDAVGLWNRALTSGEVTELYNAGTGKEHPFA